jgi:DNA-binding NarL/FixJ family response regulator
MPPHSEVTSEAASLCLKCLSRLCSHANNERPARLTARERELLRLLSGGLSNKEIASFARPELQESSVKNYLRKIYVKLGLTTRLEAALWARAHTSVLAD